MSALGGRELRVESDLHLVVGDLHATVVADGQQLVLATKDAGRLLARATDSAPSVVGEGVSLRELAARVGQLLDEAGLTAQMSTDHGTLLYVGRNCGSRIGRLLLGSEHTRPGSPGAVLHAAAGYAQASEAVRSRLSYAVGGLAIAGVLALARSGRNGSRS